MHGHHLAVSFSFFFLPLTPVVFFRPFSKSCPLRTRVVRVTPGTHCLGSVATRLQGRLFSFGAHVIKWDRPHRLRRTTKHRDLQSSAIISVARRIFSRDFFKYYFEGLCRLQYSLCIKPNYTMLVFNGPSMCLP